MYVSDLFQGVGIYTTHAGKYEGEFHENLKSGGTMIWIDSRAKYEGGWLKGFFHGEGIYVGKDGTQYKGEWKKGQRSGHGSSLLPNGEKYLGDWKNDVYHGQGIYRWNNGKWRKGEWSQGKRVRWLTNDRVGGLP
jgi:hypothetical protein